MNQGPEPPDLGRSTIVLEKFGVLPTSCVVDD